MKIITLTTDFKDLYPACMKAVILDMCEGPTFIDLTHDIKQGDILSAAFALYTTTHLFPAGTIHLAVVDPGVGTSRKAIIVRAANHYFVGPDNGLLIPAAQSMGDIEVFEIGKKAMLGKVSNTFHGRDIFAPTAGLLASGYKVEDIGQPIESFKKLSFGEANATVDKLYGKVLYIDSFGNVITNIPSKMLEAFAKPAEKLLVQGNVAFYSPTYGKVQKNELLILTGSHDFLEIAVNGGNAAQRLDITDHPKIQIEK
ncbi:MAG: SAM hydrolase/SAM-dependent halogenase family protein [Methanohalophilus sp.]